MGEHGVVDGVAALELRTLERVERSRGVGAQRGLRARQVARGPQERERELGAASLPATTSYSSSPSWSTASPTGAVGAVDEAPGDERREPDLVRAALGGEAAVHDGERALGVGPGDAARAAGSGRGAGGRGTRWSSSTWTRTNRSWARSSSVVRTSTTTALVAAAGARRSSPTACAASGTAR